MRNWSLHEDRKITKQRFGVIFSKVWDKAATPVNIKAGFEATGIYPFNPDRIPEEAYALSIPTYNPMPIVDNKDTDTDVSESLLHEAASNISAINTPVQQLTLSDNNFNSLSASTEQIGNSATTPSQNITVCNEPKKSFYDLLKTPEKSAKRLEMAPRKKTINNLAQELKKSIFPEKKNILGPSNSITKRSEKRKELTQKHKKKQVDKQHKSKKCTESW
ncbi:unnamed protein product [Parnassius apollo]|uniref:(apollo) hypothetical protein n=1 Tax=Parnassius apollo TaxID=110799 RepID=A0A8S3X728_PARAO|nr:unnamed protein product [Parnassius apollo]